MVSLQRDEGMVIVQEDIKSQARSRTGTRCNRRSDTMCSQWPLWFAGQFKCAVERIKWVNAGPLKAVKTKLRSRSASITSPSLSPSAVYLCKRTMQNKARLELADYEAVSKRGLIVSALPSSYICSQALSPVFLLMLKLRTFVFLCVTATFLSPKLLNESRG